MKAVMDVSISTKYGEFIDYPGNQQLLPYRKEPCCMTLINWESD
jgi:hypothetical protein